MSIYQTGIHLQSLSVVRNCFVEFAVFFQERAIAVVRLGGPGGQSNGRFAFGSRLVVVTELLQNISIAGMILGIVGLDSQGDSNVTGAILPLPYCKEAQQ